MSGTAPYYTQAFSPLPGRCFRLVSGGEGGGPTHCPEPPVWRGPFRTQRPPLPGRGVRGPPAQVTTAPG
jgi:hypothetical protein